MFNIVYTGITASVRILHTAGHYNQKASIYQASKMEGEPIHIRTYGRISSHQNIAAIIDELENSFDIERATKF